MLWIGRLNHELINVYLLAPSRQVPTLARDYGDLGRGLVIVRTMPLLVGLCPKL